MNCATDVSSNLGHLELQIMREKQKVAKVIAGGPEGGGVPEPGLNLRTHDRALKPLNLA